MASMTRLLIIFAFCGAFIGTCTSSRTREFFIAAVEKDWNYAPSGINKLSGVKLENDSGAAFYMVSGPHRIGRVYRKVMYRAFTDGTFTKEKPHPKHLGLLGPLIKGEVGDTLIVHFKNMAHRPFTMHPHGVFYDKGSEGALYDDHTKGNLKGDDSVPPNKIRDYVWKVTESHAPTKDDENCLTYVYHSHVAPSRDINTGLVGPILTCKKGALDPSSGARTDVDIEFFLLFTVFDENESWLLDQNIQRFCSKPDEAMQLKSDGDFVKSNRMYGINGRVFGNLEELDMCHGDSISWHVFGIGTDYDVHAAYFHGQVFTIDSHKRSIATLLPATFVAANMKAINPGTWLLNCIVTSNYDGGMFALFNVSKCDREFQTPVASGGKTRTYYIASEEHLWDYGPTGLDQMSGENLTKPGSDSYQYFIQKEDRIGGKYKKALFIEYTDETFSNQKQRTEYEIHLGSLGPVIRGEVGDTIEVFFYNKASRNYSVHPIGVLYNKSNEGALYEDGTSGREKEDDLVPPGGNFTYRWTVPGEMGPSPSDAQCLTRMYLSSVNPTKDRYAGLFGPLLVCRRGSLDADNRQKNVDREFVLHLVVTLEKNSWYYEENKNRALDPSSIDESDSAFTDSIKFHDINGYVYGNQPGLVMCKGDRVSWHVMSGILMHTAYFYGNTILLNEQRTDAVGLIQGSLATVYMTPDNPGEWSVLCKTTSHLTGGMVSKYTVRDDCGKSVQSQLAGKVRRYYIAAEEEVWDYAPSGEDILGGKTLQESENAAPYTEQGPQRIGRKYKKAVYHGYTDATFSTKLKRTTDYEKHLGIMGPVIRAEVGDTIEVVFKNMASRPYSVHPHGLLYKKKYEGSNYRDGTVGSDTDDNALSPGKLYKYVWQVPARAGPTENDTDCLVWAYYSDTASVKDFYTGLVGPLLVCRKDTLTEDNRRRNVDREFFLLFSVFDENRNWYIDDNIRNYCSNPGPLDQLKGNGGFKESNQMYAINGFLYGNLPGLKMYKGEKVEWYLMGLGDLTDIHTVHFHGQTFIHKSSSYHRGDVYDLFPGIYASVEMTPDSLGDWLLHCHVNNHLSGGMETLFIVMEPNTEQVVDSGAPKKGVPGVSLEISLIVCFFYWVLMYS